MNINLDWMEKIVTYKSLFDEEYIATIVDYIDPSFFNNNDLALIYSIVSDFFNRRKSLPNTTEIQTYLDTNDKRESFKRALSLIANIDNTLNRDELFANTERFIKERGIYKTMLSVAKDVSAGEIDTCKILDSFEKTCNVTLIHDIGLDLFKDFNRIEADLKQKTPTISSGYKWLDEKLGGGFVQSGRAMYVFAGETNIGKSIILSNLAINIARQQKTVLVITLEMSELMYGKRITSSIVKTSTNSLANDIEVVSAKMANYEQSTNSRIIIKEFPPSCITPRDLLNYIRKVQKAGIKIDAIVLDYINLLTINKGKDTYERLKYISEETRALTYHFNCPLITVTQLNRTGYSVEEPGLTALSESYALGATADFIASMWQGEGDNSLGVLRLTMLKNRFERNTGTMAFKIDYPTLTIAENEAINNMTMEAEDVTRSLMMLSDIKS